jgi:hypothetical protein
MGGSDNMNNLAMACSGCNSTRGDHFEAEVFYEMVSRGANLRRPTIRKAVDLESLAKKAAEKDLRTARLLLGSATTLTALDLWWWFNCWYDHGLSVLDNRG